MKNKTIISLFFVVMGLLFILIPTYILPVCPLPDVSPIPMDVMAHNSHVMQHGSGKIMNCYWTARAEIGIGSVVIAIGLLMFFVSNLFIRIGLSLSLACIAILAAAIPTVLIGVCSGEMQNCNIITKPTLVIISGVLFIVSVLNTLYLNKISKKMNKN